MKLLPALLLAAVAGPLFATTSFLAAGSAPAGVPVEFATFTDLDHDGKVDGDGILDLVGKVPNALSVALGNGDGTFAKALLSLGTASLVVTTPAAVDLDGDGRIDIVVPEYDRDGIAIYTGNDDGTFQAPVTLATLTSAGRLVVGNFDDDGRPDIAVSHFSADAISILHNDSSPSAWHHRGARH